GGCSCCV
ncbi:hypothetical protein VCHC78A1_03326B, partial [Vibrio cholerae HC-78A1]